MLVSWCIERDDIGKAKFLYIKRILNLKNHITKIGQSKILEHKCVL